MKVGDNVSNRQRQQIVSVIIMALILILLWYVRTNNTSEAISESQQVTLGKCVDGDTAHFTINQNDVTVRFLAIDTPETKHPQKGQEPFGKEASEYTCTALMNAESIILEYDPKASVDKYDRILAWVFVDGELLQEKLISLGYAKTAYLYDDYLYTEQLLNAETKAKEAKLGIWQ